MVNLKIGGSMTEKLNEDSYLPNTKEDYLLKPYEHPTSNFGIEHAVDTPPDENESPNQEAIKGDKNIVPSAPEDSITLNHNYQTPTASDDVTRPPAQGPLGDALDATQIVDSQSTSFFTDERVRALSTATSVETDLNNEPPSEPSDNTINPNEQKDSFLYKIAQVITDATTFDVGDDATVNVDTKGVHYKSRF